jgi:ribulose kinase
MALAAVVVLAGCAASSHVLVGTARTPISPDQVKIYLQPPPRYEEIATIDASSSGTPVFTDQRKMDRAIGRLKQEAAKLGANGILLEGTSDQQTGGIGLGTGSASGNSAFGIGTSFGIVIKTATGIAIYVAPL